MAFEEGFITRKRCVKLCLAFVSTSASRAFLVPRWGAAISSFLPRTSERNSRAPDAAQSPQGHECAAGYVDGSDRFALTAPQKTLQVRNRSDLPRKIRAGRQFCRFSNETSSQTPGAA